MVVDSDVDACMICVGKGDCSESDLLIRKFKSYGANEWVWSACRWHNKSSDLWRFVVRVDVEGGTRLLRYLSGLRVVVVRFDDYIKRCFWTPPPQEDSNYIYIYLFFPSGIFVKTTNRDLVKALSQRETKFSKWYWTISKRNIHLKKLVHLLLSLLFNNKLEVWVSIFFNYFLDNL